ncbi:AMP-binding protein [Syntrophus aciditrophicus]|uniref:Long-chain-fatty-acid--CoA ligase n=1 Tax=Syntrophus aciditrophicus (strain SB) TaxID=56780 RepID=Q2LWQ6_SYNAS|nr:AMP-binding protein [Syntrophus aciditrophicus]ABC78516.1 long-chain-fatty-acid--CoA ligase [Syntrophus aciditrophicus SB]OPY16604.1 MAG: Long-chain-fatty-acid--CoA ligase [Syntrophus sp. PtaB.Bin075]
MNLGRMLDETCRRYPDHIAVVQEERRLTYAALNAAVNALGNALKDLGLGKNDKLAIVLPNCPEFIISYFAAQKIGAVAVTINTASTPHEILYLLTNSDARALITTSACAGRFESILQNAPLCGHLIVVDRPEYSPPSSGNFASFWSLIEESSSSLDIPELSDDDPAVMIYTAGLTGKPLGAVLTQRNLVTQSALLGDLCHVTDTDMGLSVIPLFHTFGAVANMLGAIRVGAGLVLMDAFNLDEIFQLICREKVTFIAAVPRLFLGMLFYEDADKYDVSSLRFCITGGAAMPAHYVPEFNKKFQATLVEGYGLTEASPVCTLSRPDGPQKPGSIGTAIPGVEIRIVNDQGTDCSLGEVGELILRGDNVMKCYYKEEEATREVIVDGWLHTGDLAFRDREGFFFLTGRKKRMIITSGFNVYPREVELVLEGHPAVRATLVVSKPNLLRGEIVKAFIVKDPAMQADSRQILRHCRTYLSSYKVPREVEFVESLQEKDKIHASN